MIFKNLTLANFKSFIGKHEFDFMGTKPGLYFISGENQAESVMGSNGSGKSSLIDAFKWVITGKTVRNLKAGDVHSRNVKGLTYAELTLELNNSEYKIYRSWSPNKLTISTNGAEPVSVTQEQVDKLIGLNEDDIHNSIIYGQFNQSFLDLQPSQMLQVFTGILDLELWTDRSEKAAQEKNKYQTEQTKVELKIQNIKGQLEQLQQSLVTTKELSKKFESEKEQELVSIQNEYDKVVAELEQLPKEAKVDAVTNPKLTELLTKLQEIREVIDEIRTDESNIKSRIMVSESDHRRFSNELKKLQGLVGTCSECGQNIPPPLVDKRINEKQVERLQVEDTLSDLLSHKTNIAVEYSEALTLLKSTELEIENERKAEREAIRIANEQSKKRLYLASKENELATLFDRVNNSTSPYAGSEQKISIQIDEKLREIHQVTNLIDELNLKVSVYDKWVKGFKEIRLLVIEEALTDLEVEVNNSISELGLEGWSIKFDIEKENKSGGITKGFSALVYSPTNASPVPWAAWSGGEGQRLRLAVSAGLSALILSRRNVNPNVIIFDEPSKNLSKEGIEHLVQYLAFLSKSLNKQVYLVDHHTIESSACDGVVRIIKDSNGSRIEV